MDFDADIELGWSGFSKDGKDWRHSLRLYVHGCFAHLSPLTPKGVLCIPLPLDVQGGIKGGVESTVRFGSNSTPHLDSDFRRNDEVVQSTRGGIKRGLDVSFPCHSERSEDSPPSHFALHPVIGIEHQNRTTKTPLYFRLDIKGEWMGKSFQSFENPLVQQPPKIIADHFHHSHHGSPNVKPPCNPPWNSRGRC